MLWNILKPDNGHFTGQQGSMGSHGLHSLAFHAEIYRLVYFSNQLASGHWRGSLVGYFYKNVAGVEGIFTRLIDNFYAEFIAHVLNDDFFILVFRTLYANSDNNVFITVSNGCGKT